MATFCKHVLVTKFSFKSLSYAVMFKTTNYIKITSRPHNKWSVDRSEMSYPYCVNFKQKYTTDNTKEKICWKCGKVIDASKDQFVCPCGVLQPPNEDSTLFEVMGLEESFKLDTELLTKKFRDLQKVLHPDKFSQKPQIEKDNSEKQSSLVNKAYFTLLKPVSRGLYMLQLHGEHLEEGEIQMEGTFLMNIMELNEELAEVASLEDLTHFEKANMEVMSALIFKLQEAFRTKDIQHAKTILAELKYYSNIDEKIKEKRLTFL